MEEDNTDSSTDSPLQFDETSEPPPDSYISTSQSISYWTSVDSSVNGMLGGYPQVSRIDLQGSRNFWAKLKRISPLAIPDSCPFNTSTANGQTNGHEGNEREADKNDRKLNLVVDCGAGIGRISSGFLSQISRKVDIVEPVSKFTDTLVASVQRSHQNQNQNQNTSWLGQIFNVGLESFTPPANKSYDLIWNQWCLGHLTDAQLVEYFRRITPSLTIISDDLELNESNSSDLKRQKNQRKITGWIIVKENLSQLPPSHSHIHTNPHSSQYPTSNKYRSQGSNRFVLPTSSTTSSDNTFDTDAPANLTINDDNEEEQEQEDIYDDEDSSVTRSDGKFRALFQKAGLKVVRMELQRGFPRELGLFPVAMYALRPDFEAPFWTGGGDEQEVEGMEED